MRPTNNISEASNKITKREVRPPAAAPHLTRPRPINEALLELCGSLCRSAFAAPSFISIRLTLLSDFLSVVAVLDESSREFCLVSHWKEPLRRHRRALLKAFIPGLTDEVLAGMVVSTLFGHDLLTMKRIYVWSKGYHSKPSARCRPSWRQRRQCAATCRRGAVAFCV